MFARMQARSLALAVALVALPGVAAAAPADEQLAQSLFDAGRLLMDKGDYARACPMLAESQRLDPGGGTLLNLAVCHEREGKLGLAWTEMNQALSQAIKDGRKDREQTARERLAAIEPKLPRLLLEYAGAPPEGLVVELDGTQTSAAMLGVAAPLDAGKHTVRITAPGRVPFTWEGELTPEKTTKVAVPALAPDPRAAQTSDGPRGPAPLPPKNAERSTTTAVILGAGAGVLAVGAAVTYGLSLKAASDAKDVCIPDRNYCASDDGVSAVSRSRTLTWVSIGMATGAGVAGIAALAMGLVSVVTHVKGAEITVTPTVGAGTLGATGRF